MSSSTVGSRTLSARFGLVLRFIVTAAFCVFLFFPFYWMLVTSLTKSQELYNPARNPLIIQMGATLNSYAYLFQHTHFVLWYLNTLLITIIVTAFSLALSTMAAYSITRLRYRGRSVIAVGIFVTYLVPPTLLFIPLYGVVTALGLSNTIWALVLTYPTFVVPFCTWLLMAFFKSIPKELEESAMIDGASRLTCIVRIVLPVALPGIMSAGLFSFTLSWSQFLYGLAFISSSDKKPLAVGVVTELVRGDVFYWGSLMAGALLTCVPIALIYGFFTRYFITGLTSGATKY